MKHLAIAALFATSLVAQNVREPHQPAVPRDPEIQARLDAAKLELANIIAVEEQEQDLVKAERLYRAAMSDAKLSAAAKRLATLRLAQLLSRLGKVDEAKQLRAQADKGAVVSLDDVTNGLINNNHTKELRLQARELLRSELTNNMTLLIERLDWIGAPAVPEVVAYLQESIGKSSASARIVEPLLRFLWQHGGPQAAKFLVQVASVENWQVWAAAAAGSRQGIDVNAPEVRAYLDHEQWSVAGRFLGIVANQIGTDDLLGLAQRGSSSMKSLVLKLFVSRSLSSEQRAQTHTMCREALEGTNPELANAAELFLYSSESQQSIVGVLMLMELLPDRVASKRFWPEWLTKTDSKQARQFTADEVDQLLVALQPCLKRIGQVEQANRATDWLGHLMYLLMAADAQKATPQALAMWDLGYSMFGYFTKHIAEGYELELLKRWSKVRDNDRLRLLGAIDAKPLPAAALPLLIECAKDLGNSFLDPVYKKLVTMIAETGDDQAADWLVEQWHANKAQYLASGLRPNIADVLASALIQLGQHNQSERVRAAMHIIGFGDADPRESDQARLLLALLSMGDERAPDLVAKGIADAEVPHPYADRAKRALPLTPAMYLIYDNPEPPHGYSQQQVLDTVGKYAKLVSGKNVLNPSTIATKRISEIATKRISDPVLAVLALHQTSFRSDVRWNWQEKLVSRLNQKLASGADVSILEKAFLAMLGDPRFLNRWQSRSGLAAHYRPQIAALVTGEHEAWAMQAIRMVGKWSDAEVDGMLRNPHADVREWAVQALADGSNELPATKVLPLLHDASASVRSVAATYLGSVVSKDAVPGLIELLRDTDGGVREQATAALTRIRFYHEQQAHWDRVLQGLDASPASAAEKLLVQAKPGASKQQRLLAIKSLGVLGVPEALPFLIEWSQESDGDIQVAAKEAITQIHLNPRK